MNKQLKNMLELAQPRPATPQQLMDAIMAECLKDDTPVANEAHDMYGNLYDGGQLVNDPKGTKGVKKCAIALAIEYDDTCAIHNNLPTTLDDRFIGLAKFVLVPKVLFKCPKKQEECWQCTGRHCAHRHGWAGEGCTLDMKDA